MDSNSITEGDTGARRQETEESDGNNTAATDALSQTSVDTLETTASTLSTVSSVSSINVLEETVIEGTAGDNENVDYKAMCGKYQDLLTERNAALLKSEEDRRNEYNKLLELFNALDAEKKPADREITDKDKVIASQKVTIDSHGSTANIKDVCGRRNTDECIKTKTKRRNGSSKNVEVNKCEYPGCGGIDTDLAMCSACGKYVCEACNKVPVSKLKAVMKLCDTVYFLCKDCCAGTETSSSHYPPTGNGEKMVESLREEITDKIKIIKSLEAGQQTLNDLVEDRDTVVKSQKTIIENIKIESGEIKDDLNETRKIVAIKEKEIADIKSVLAELESAGCGKQETVKELMAKAENTEVENQILKKKLDDQTSLTKKAELAFNTQEKLTLSKCEVIENLKTIISQSKSTPTFFPGKETQINHVTSNVSDQTETKENGGSKNLRESIPGFQESVLCLSSIALHGMVVNGLLLWVDIQRRTVPANEWKEKAAKHFTAGEISNAKDLLWDVCDEKVVGRNVNRQGVAKQQAEINDIEFALNALAEKQALPLFVGSSTMVMQTPQQESSPTIPSYKDIEQIVETAMKKRTGQLEKKYDQSFSKQDQGIKKMDDLIKRLEVLKGCG